MDPQKVLSIVCIDNIIFYWAIPTTFFIMFRFFFTQFTVNKCSIKVADDWIRTRVLGIIPEATVLQPLPKTIYYCEIIKHVALTDFSYLL